MSEPLLFEHFESKEDLFRLSIVEPPDDKTRRNVGFLAGLAAISPTWRTGAPQGPSTASPSSESGL